MTNQAQPFDWTINEEVLGRTVKMFKERNILLPTFDQMLHPHKTPEHIKKRLEEVKMEAVDPANLFRITWKNNPNTHSFGGTNVLEFPPELTGVKTRIFALVGKHFPIGAHKVGAAYGCLVPKIITGQFDPQKSKAVWPSTGNYCRGGAFDCAVLGCTSVAILPEGMSKERFEWLKMIGSEIIATPGTESNVKEIYDECNRIKREHKDWHVFNQFDEMGNPLWHYSVTGPSLEETFNIIAPGANMAGFVSATGSAGTIAAGDYLRTKFPRIKVNAVESKQCPTMINNGFGDHRIEGIGDKHVPWVHNILNTDVVTAIDDEACMRLMRLFNEPEGLVAMREAGIPESFVSQAHLCGISTICNMLAAVKMSKYFEFDENDVVCTLATDSVDLYKSRVEELKVEYGPYSKEQGRIDLERYLWGEGIDYLKELSYQQRKSIHNLKYFTWVEQQGKTSSELNALWTQRFWKDVFAQQEKMDELITAFNRRTGLDRPRSAL